MSITAVGQLDLHVNRYAKPVIPLAFIGIDLSTYTFALQVRVTRDAPGAPLINLATVTTTGEGVRYVTGQSATTSVQSHITLGRLNSVPDGYSLTDVITVSTINIQLNETTVENLPFPAERGDDVTLWWDMLFMLGSTKERWLEGQFIVHAGVTNA